MLHIHWNKKGKGISKELENFFSSDLSELRLVKRSFPPVDLPNIQTALNQLVQSARDPIRVLGYTSQHSDMQNSLRDLISKNSYASIGPVQYRDVDTGIDSRIQCLENGILLFVVPEGKLAIHVRGQNYMTQGLIEVEILGNSPDLGQRYIEQIREAAAKQSVYKHKILSLECDNESWGERGMCNVRFHHFEEISREQIILPEQTLELIERNSIHFLRHAELLKRSGRSLKRGLLLHGKPGTGKTLTIRWLATTMEGVTVILMSGEQLWLIKECCSMARMLAPSVVILEDVDLIASERDEMRHPFYQISLHQLLNEMDGLSSESEVLFILTTNRPGVIEPALSLRPGRIDQAIELPLPDVECRHRLFELYCQGLKVEQNILDTLVDKTAGASPAFINEFVRKASLIAADSAGVNTEQLLVKAEHFHLALEELLIYGGELTRNLLGFAPPHSSHN